MSLNDQEKLIGKHPDAGGLFSSWLAHNDTPSTSTLRHRELNPDTTKRQMRCVNKSGHKTILNL